MKTLLFFVLVLLIVSCSDNPVNPVRRNYEIPSGVGTFWKYALHDTVTQEHDTVLVNIISGIEFADGKVSRWTFQNFYNVDTLTIVFAADTISGALFSFSQKYRYIFLSPMVVGSSYNTRFGQMNVIATEAVNGERETFRNCYIILNSKETDSEVSNTRYWVKPGIGIVKVHKSYFSKIGLQRQEVLWSLIDYNVSN